MATLTSLPRDMMRTINKFLPRGEFRRLCISHRNFHPHQNPKIYNRIHYEDSVNALYPQHKWLFHEERSTTIHDLPSLVRTFESSEALRFLVSEASFQWSPSMDASVKPEVLKILRLVGKSLRKLHYAPARWDHNVPRAYGATSVNMPYPVLKYRRDYSQDENLIHSLFSIPTLRHVTLHQCTCILYSSYPKISKAGTSNIEYLSIKDTPRKEVGDLSQLIVWPKALKVLDCTYGLSTEYIDTEIPWDPSEFPAIIMPQRASLEQLSLDFAQRTETLGTFGTSLRQFPKLKRLSVPRNFLASIDSDFVGISIVEPDEEWYLDVGFGEVYLALPPALEELVLNIDKDLAAAHYGDEYLTPHFQQWVRDIATHKQELYPSLKRVVLWQTPPYDGHTPANKLAWEKKIIEFLGMSQEFEDAGIEFVFTETDVVPDFQNAELCL